MRSLLLSACLLLAACAAPAPPAPAGRAVEVSPAEAVVQTQLEAYNRGDLEAFLATYAPDVRIYDHPDELRMEGIGELRKQYGGLFERVPELHAAIERRIVRGDYVIDHEHVTGIPGGQTVRVVAIYQVQDGKIRNVWFLR